MYKKAWMVIFSGSLFVFLFISIFSSKKHDMVAAAAGSNNMETRSASMPEVLTFAGERIPLEYFDVKESLDRELQVNTYFQSQTIFYIKRANRFFPIIDTILAQEGVPLDFKYLAVAESGLLNVISPAKAVGFWQILPGTAKELGLEINEEVDERYNLELSTRAACRYLKDTYREFGSWTLAAASYNMGRNALRKQIEMQKEKTYFDLQLNEETARYIFRIIAIKLIIENPSNYGFYIEPKEMYPPYQYSVVNVTYHISDLVDFAKKNETSYKMLKMLNPWLRSNSLRLNPNKTYSLKIPGKGFRESLYQEEATARLVQ